MRMKILASANSSERKFSAWIGGSILASLVSWRVKFDELGVGLKAKLEGGGRDLIVTFLEPFLGFPKKW